MPFVESLDRWHARTRASPLLYRVVLATRCLFAMAFVPTGLVKAMGERFTVISVETPIGAFFEAMYRTGPYWRFLGAAQLAAGVLMLVPRLATLGAVLFLPVAVNIFVITVALGFRGTPLVTGPMLLGALVLVAWDWHRVRGIVTTAPSAVATVPDEPTLGPLWERGAWAIGCAAGMAFFAVTRSLLPPPVALPALALGSAAALVALAGTVRALRDGRRLRGEARRSAA
jgi:hypothetical protein